MVCEATAGPSLDDQLSFPPSAASRAMSRVYRRLLDLPGLTSPQTFALLVLWSGDAPTVSEVDEQLQLASATLQLKRRAAAGLIDRMRFS